MKRPVKLPRALALPWLFYLAGTIGVPALNGAWKHPEFWTHTADVFSISLLLGAMAAALAAVIRAAKQRTRDA